MPQKESFQMFIGDQERMYRFFRTRRDALLNPLVQWLAARKVAPHTLTIAGLLMLVPFLYFFSFHPLIAFLFLALNLLCDNLDGGVARLTHKASLRGAFADLSADYFSFCVVFLAFVFFGMFSPFWSALYLLSYAVLQGFTYYAHSRELLVFPTFPTKLIFYGLFLLWVLSGISWFDPFLVFASVYMVITNIFLFLRIFWSLSSH